MNKLLILILSLVLMACGGGVSPLDTSSSTPAGDNADAATRADKPSVCLLPDGIGDVCDPYEPDNQSWFWLNTSREGEQVHRCNQIACPSGATCMVQTDVSGEDDGGELMMGVCQ